MYRRIVVLVAIVVAASIWPTFLLAADSQAAKVSFTRNTNSLQIEIDGQPVGKYVLNDEQILRPYIRHIRTLGGRQVTRNCPPLADDLDDHATMHPGLWLAFGDLSGADFWRNKGKVKHLGFVKGPLDGAGQGSFAVQNSYEADDKRVCIEQCSITISVRPMGYLLDWTSVFRSETSDFTFGDQEEMGLGVRVSTPLAVVKGGEIIDSEGRKNGKQVWGQQADWCQYGGIVDDRQIGLVLMPDPQNFHRSWFHARDYGLVVANPFGRNAFTKGEKSSVVVPKDNQLRLRFGVLVYDVSAASPLPANSAYKDFVETNQQSP